jgi:hypothetical protein
MKDADWLTCTEVRRMLPAVRHRLSERKLRLLACGCCRRVWRLLRSERSRRAVALAERYADGLADRHRLFQASEEARQPVERTSQQVTAAATVAAMIADPRPLLDRRDFRFTALAVALDELSRATDEPTADGTPHSTPCELLRDLLGPATGAVVFDPAWRTSDLQALARRAYDDRDFAVLPVLGDALEDAGCTSDALLTHCRAGAGHARGCWALDLVLEQQ